MQWFPFLTIMERTANILKPNKGLIPSLLKYFAMFQFRIIGDKYDVDSIAIMCINYKKKTVHI